MCLLKWEETVLKLILYLYSNIRMVKMTRLNIVKYAAINTTSTLKPDIYTQ